MNNKKTKVKRYTEAQRKARIDEEDLRIEIKKKQKEALIKENKKKVKKQTIRETQHAIEKSLGFLSIAADILGLTAGAITRRKKKYPVLQEVYDSMLEKRKDMAEHAIIKIFSQADDLKAATIAAKYYLDNQAKDRGYGKESEKNDDNNPIYEIVEVNLPEK